MVVGNRPTAPARPAQTEPAGPINPNVPSRQPTRIVVEKARSGMSGPAYRGSIGDPFEQSRNQEIAAEVRRLGFGGNFKKRLMRDAENEFLEMQRQEAPRATQREMIDPGDIRGRAFDMAMERVSTIKDPNVRSTIESIVREEFGASGSSSFPIAPGQLRKGIQKAEPRKGLIGDGPISRKQEGESRTRFLQQDRDQDRKIAAAGLGDERMRDLTRRMREAEDNGDVDEYNKLKAEFAKTVGASAIMSGEQSVHDPTRTAKQRITDISKQESERTDRFGSRDRGEKPGMTKTEGKVNVDGAIGEENLDTVSKALRVIATDEGLTDKFLSRFSPKDQEAFEKAFKNYRDNPGSDLGQLVGADLLSRISKTISIEALVKNQAKTQAAKSPAGRRSLENWDTPESRAIKSEELKGRKQLVSKAIAIIEGIKQGNFYDKPTGKARGSGRAELTREMNRVMQAYSRFGLRPSVIERIRGDLRTAVGQSMNGNESGLNKHIAALRLVARREVPPDLDRMIDARKGAEPMPQLDTLSRGGPKSRPNTKALQKGIPGARIQDPEPGERGTRSPAPAMGKARRPVIDLGLSPRDTFEEMLQRIQSMKKSPETAGVSPGVVYTRSRAERLGRAENKNVVPYVPPKPEARKTQKPTQQPSRIGQAFADMARELQIEAGGNKDINYGDDPQLNARVSRLMVSRIRSMTEALSKEIKAMGKKGTRSRPADLKPAARLAAARAELEMVDKALASGRVKLSDERQYEKGPAGARTGRTIRPMKIIKHTQHPETLAEMKTEVPSDGYKTIPVPEGARQTISQYRRALAQHVEALKKAVTDSDEYIERSTRGGTMGKGKIQAAVDEGFRNEIAPGRLTVARMQDRLSKLEEKKNPAPGDKDEIAQLRRQLEIVKSRDSAELAKQKAAQAAKRQVDPKNPEVRGTAASPLPEIHASRRGVSLADEREFTGGEYSGDVKQKPGRRKSGMRKQLDAARKSGKILRKPRRFGTRANDLSAMEGDRALAGLIQGLPR